VHASEISTGITQIASGSFRLVAPSQFPIRIGIAGSGTVVAVGSSVTSLAPGDAVYGLFFKHGIFPPPVCGFVSDYVVVPADVLLPKPEGVSFEEAAALTGSVVTVYQCVKRWLELTGQEGKGVEALQGKTAFVTGALSAVGSVAVQALKNVYGMRVVATVSTAKMGLVEGELPGVVDQLVDYQKEDVVVAVGRGKVDLVFSSQWDPGMVGLFPLANPETGAVVSIASVPSAETLRKMLGDTRIPFQGLVLWLSKLANMWYRWKLRGTNVKQDFISGNPGNREDLVASGKWVSSRKVKAVMTVVNLDDIEAVRKGCGHVFTGKGGLGKLVIKLV